MDSYTDDGIPDGTLTVGLTESCGWNKATAPDELLAMDREWATDFWYDFGAGYDWGTKAYSPVAQDFTNMIWRSTTKVGFGVAGRAVVALYCPEGNIRGRFECNVCPTEVGCDEDKCPHPDSVCSSTDGEGNAEISLNEDGETIRIIATVAKGQIYTISFGSSSLVDSDLFVFHAKSTADLSFAKDSTLSAVGEEPTPAASSAIEGLVKEDEGDYIRFDMNRRLAPGTAGHFAITKGTTHDMAWGQYASSDFARLSGQGTCTLKLPGEEDPVLPDPDQVVTPACPV